MPDKIDFKSKTVTRDNEGYIMLKRSVHLEVIAIVDIYVPSIMAPK